MSSLSTQWVRYTVTAQMAGAAYNPTSDVVTFGFMPFGIEPQGSDYVPGSWETVTGPPVSYVARCLVGPASGSAKVLGKGDYVVWIKITDNPEVPVLSAGVLEIT